MINKIILVLTVLVVGCVNPFEQKEENFYEYSRDRNWKRLPLLYPYEAYYRGMSWDMELKKNDKWLNLDLFKIEKGYIIGLYTKTSEKDNFTTETDYYIVKASNAFEKEFYKEKDFLNFLDSIHIDLKNMRSAEDVYYTFEKYKTLPWDTVSPFYDK